MLLYYGCQCIPQRIGKQRPFMFFLTTQCSYEGEKIIFSFIDTSYWVNDDDDEVASIVFPLLYVFTLLHRVIFVATILLKSDLLLMPIKVQLQNL